MDQLEVKNLSYKSILKDINISFQENGFYFISGPNKCGKTTLIRMLCGNIEIEDSIFYQNKDIYTFSSYDLSTLFGSVILSDDLQFQFSTIDQELLFRLDQLDLDSKESKKRYKELIDLFDLKNDLYKNVNDLPLYKKIEVLLVKELLSTPSILFLDDIFLSIDVKTSISILSKLKNINNLIVVLASTNLELSTEFDYLYILNKGNILLQGSTYDVLKEDSLLNKLGLELPFMVDLSLKLKYYNLLDDIELNMNRMVNRLWK